MGRVLRLAWCFFIGFLLGAWGVSAHASYGNWGRSVNVNYPGVSSGARNPSWNSGPIYDFPGAPDGWGKMRDINRLNLGGRAIDLAGTRLFSPSALTAAAIGVVKSGGWLGLGLTLAPLIWDAVEEQWLISEEASDWPGLYTHSQTGWTAQCTVAPGCTAEQIRDVLVAYRQSLTSDRVWRGTVIAKADGSADKVLLEYAMNSSPGSWIVHSNQALLRVGEWTAETRPATDAEIEDAIYVELVSRGMGSDLARRLIEAGYTPAVESITASGPSSVAGGSTTSTTSSDAGITTITTTTNYNITYSGDTANITETTTSTKTNPDSTTETTTETKSPAEGEAAAPEEQPGLCEQYPDSIACQDMDTPAEEKPADTEIPVSLTPSGGFGAESGSCPADVSLVLGGYPVTWSYAGPCQFFSAVRPAVIAVAWIAAVLIALGAYRKGD